ncbi:DUF2272 domain-containing protein [Terrarubrum flagellatum]|uniref:DUF2272 domain-containing protein n=1 Tax=Terrirubrum flagellatum TaxID=2895980 RepID=UPI0031456CE0
MIARRIRIVLSVVAIFATTQAAFAQVFPDPRQRVEMRFERPETKSGASFARVKDSQCRESVANVSGDATLRRRIVSLAAREWEAFHFPTFDIASVGLPLVPQVQSRAGSAAIVPGAINPALDRPLPRALRLGLAEDDGEVMERIGGYWAVTPGQDAVAVQNVIWGRGGWPGTGWAIPWSAAFVSWVMCEAGLTRPQFARAAKHSAYLSAMFENAEASAFTPADLTTPVAAGDLVCTGRAENRDIASLDEARRAATQGALMHCDIVVGKLRDRVLLIGGNVINAVTLTIALADAKGRVKSTALRPWFGVMKLKVPEDKRAGLRDMDWACLGKADALACLEMK